jgi:hypothetical protein
MQLRWLIRKNVGVTAQQVREYAHAQYLTMAEAKRKLINETEPRLQYLDMEAFDSDRGEWGLWRDVPTVVVPHGE